MISSQPQYDRGSRADLLAASAFSLTALNESPGGSMSPFCEPATVTSTPPGPCSRPPGTPTPRSRAAPLPSPPPRAGSDEARVQHLERRTVLRVADAGAQQRLAATRKVLRHERQLEGAGHGHDHDLVARDSDLLELGKRRSRGIDVEHDIMRLAVLGDPVGKAAEAPGFGLDDLSAIVLDDFGGIFRERIDLGLSQVLATVSQSSGEIRPSGTTAVASVSTSAVWPIGMRSTWPLPTTTSLPSSSRPGSAGRSTTCPVSGR